MYSLDVVEPAETAVYIIYLSLRRSGPALIVGVV